MTSAADAPRPATADATVRLPAADQRSAAAPPGPPMRASDADRMATVLALQHAVGTGCLTPGEGSDRMAAAFAAVHVRELAPLVADLPPAPAPVGPADRSWRARWSELDPSWRLVLLVAALMLTALVVGSMAAHLVVDAGPGGFGGPRAGGSGPGGLTPR